MSLAMISPPGGERSPRCSSEEEKEHSRKWTEAEWGDSMLLTPANVWAFGGLQSFKHMHEGSSCRHSEFGHSEPSFQGFRSPKFSRTTQFTWNSCQGKRPLASSACIFKDDPFLP